MHKAYTFTWAACLWLLTSAPEISVGEDIDVKTCVDAFNASLRSIQSYDVYIEATEGGDSDEPHDRVLPKRKIESSRQVFDSKGRRRYERFDMQTGATEYLQLNDGEQLVIFWSQRMQALIDDPKRTNTMAYSAPAANYAASFRQLLDETEILLILQKRNCRATETDGGLMIECLPDPAAKWFPRAGWRFFFMQKPSLMLRRIEYYHLEMTKPRLTTEVLEFYKAAPNLWVPGRVRHTAYAPNGKKLQHYELKVDKSKSVWNQELSEDAFKFKFPPGTKLFDRNFNVQPPRFPFIDPRKGASLRARRAPWAVKFNRVAVGIPHHVTRSSRKSCFES